MVCSIGSNCPVVHTASSNCAWSGINPCCRKVSLCLC
jgi:hypothetical protein